MVIEGCVQLFGECAQETDFREVSKPVLYYKIV